MEHNICDVLAQRMKGRKMSWSIKGADNLAKILAEKFSGRLFETVDKIYKNIIPNEVVDEIVINMSLSASKSKQKMTIIKSIKFIQLQFRIAKLLQLYQQGSLRIYVVTEK